MKKKLKDIWKEEVKKHFRKWKPLLGLS